MIDHGKLLFDGSFESLVKKFSPYKIISVILDAKVEKKNFRSLVKLLSMIIPKQLFV